MRIAKYEECMNNGNMKNDRSKRKYQQRAEGAFEVKLLEFFVKKFFIPPARKDYKALLLIYSLLVSKMLYREISPKENHFSLNSSTLRALEF